MMIIKIDIENYQIKHNNRLINHYLLFSSFNEIECFKKCNLDSKCVAATYYLGVNNYCYFYSENYELRFEFGWTSYFKKGN